MVASPEQDEACFTSRKVAYRRRRQPARSHRLRQSCRGSLSLRILTQPCEAFSQALPLSASPGLLNLPQKIAPHSTFASPSLSVARPLLPLLHSNCFKVHHFWRLPLPPHHY